MKKHILLLFPLTFSLFACNSKETCKIKITTDGHVMVEELKEGNLVTMSNNKDFDLHLEGEYYSNPTTGWNTEPSEDNEGKLIDPNIKYMVSIEDIQVLIDGKNNDDAFVFHPHDIFNKYTLTLKKDYIKNGTEIIINTHNYSEDGPDGTRLCLYGCELGDNLRNRYDNEEIEVHLASTYQDGLQTIKTLNNTKTFPIIEDDTMEITITWKSGEPLPTNLWYRTNARYAEMGVEFTRQYSDDGKTCTISVPHYIVKDHCEIRNNPTI